MCFTPPACEGRRCFFFKHKIMNNKIFRGNKFHAERHGGFDSKIERMVKGKYDMMQKAGLISGFRRCNWSFLIIPPIYEYTIEKKQLKTKVKTIEHRKVCEREARYTPDFLYKDEETGEYVAVEVKSYITKKLADYPLRRKLFKWRLIDHNARGRSQWRFEEIVV